MASDSSHQRRGSRSVPMAVLSGNLLLDALPENQRLALIQDAEERELSSGETLFQPHGRIGTVLFPTTAVASLCILSREGTWLGTAITGSEGFVGLPVFLGSSTTPNRLATVLIPGRAFALGVDAFLQHVDASPKLSKLLRRYTQAFITQLTQAVLCGNEHRVEERTARWLLLLHDRVPAKGFPLTHESLARMVGALRPSVTEAIGNLTRHGAIQHSRGGIAVADRARLEERACECYTVIREELERLLPLA